MDKDEKIKKMEEHISNLETELQATKEHLKKYTAPASRKIYYERSWNDTKTRLLCISRCYNRYGGRTRSR